MKEIDFVKQRITTIREQCRISERRLSEMIGKSPNYIREMTDLSRPDSCLAMPAFFQTLAALRITPVRFFDSLDAHPIQTQRVIEQIDRLTNDNVEILERYLSVLEKMTPVLFCQLLDFAKSLESTNN